MKKIKDMKKYFKKDIKYCPRQYINTIQVVCNNLLPGQYFYPMLDFYNIKESLNN